MIDWKLTESKYGMASIDGYRPKVVVRCDSCGVARDYTIRVKSKIINNDLKWLCQKCVCLRPDVRKKLSHSTSKKWTDDKYRDERSKSSLKLWDDNRYKVTHSKSVKSHSNREKCSKAAYVAWRNKSDEEKKIISLESRYRSLKLWNDYNFRCKVARSNKNRTDYISSIQIALYSILDDLDIRYVKEYPLGPYNFDCYLPDHGILIECQGDYWHSLDNNKLRDIKKASYVVNNFPRLVLKCLWEHEFKCKDKIINTIKYWTGVGISSVDFKFDDVMIREIDNSLALKFVGCYHYAGNTGNSKIRYGAFIGDMLIGLCCFGPITRKESADRLNMKTNELVELTRFCIHPRYQKKNLASWLICRSIKLIKRLNIYKCIISFADETYNHVGSIYKASNFILDGEVKPSYWYVDKDGWVMHKKTLYNHAKSLQMTEREFADSNGYLRVSGGKKYRYLYYIR